MSILEAIPVVAEFFASEESNPVSWRSGLHSGNIGDVIYSLQTCRTLGINHFVLNVCADPAFGGRVLTEQAARALAPLLLAQKFIRRVTIIKSGVPWEYANPVELGVDYILDSFRASFTNPRLHLLYAHAVPFSLMVDGARPWVTIDDEAREPRITQEPYIVVGLTSRYRRFDHAYYEYLFRNVPADRVFFVGVGNDQIERRNIGGTVFQTTNFADLAALLANSALFIGNPSFTYALAEGLKVNRFVEVPEENNVYPLDGSGSLLHMCAPEDVRTKIFEALQLQDSVRHSSVEPLAGYALANIPYVQLFFDTGSGFNETESIPRPALRGRQRYTFNRFPQDATIRSLRFDPLGDHAIVRIHHTKLSGPAGDRTLSAIPLNAAHVDASECYFTNNDPQFLVEIPEQFQHELEEIVVDMEIIAIGQVEAANSLYSCHFEKLAAERTRLSANVDQMLVKCEQLATQRDMLAGERDALAMERNQLVTERAKLVSNRDQLMARLDQLVIEGDQLATKWDQLVTERDQLVTERDQLVTERDQFVVGRGELSAERDRLLAERVEMLASRSWRITAPLRWFVRLFATR